MVIFVGVLSYEMAKHVLRLSSAGYGTSFDLYFLSDVVFFGSLGPIVVFLTLAWIDQRVVERQRAEQRLEEVYKDLKQSHQQLAVLNEIGQSIASKVDLEGILELLVRIPEQLVAAKAASIFLLDETTGRLSLAKSYGMSEETIYAGFGGEIDSEFSLTTPSQGEGPPHLSLLLGRGSQVIGALNVYLSSERFPSETEMKLLNTIANTSAAAIEGARLRARDLSALYEVDRRIRAEPNLDRLLNEILSRVIQVCRGDCGAVLLYDEEKDEFAVQLSIGANGRACEDCAQIGWGTANWTKDVKGPLVLANVRDGALCGCSGRKPRGVKSLMCAPMVTGDRLVGIISLGHHLPDVFSKSQLSLLSAIASQAALVVRNAQLYVRSEAQAIIEERSRIAREVHDGVAQELAFMMLKTDLCLDLSDPDQEELRDELKTIRRGLSQNVQEIRRAILALRPVHLDSAGLIPAVRELIDGFRKQTGLPVDLTLSGEPSHLSSDLELSLFRLVQESLNNVAKHACAKKVSVSLDFRSAASVSLVVQDDGQGFDSVMAETNAGVTRGLGLLQMKERLEAGGGHLTITTKPGIGVRLKAVLPLDG